MKEGRNYSIDLLRIAACFMVIVIHVIADTMKHTEVTSTDFRVMNLYNCAVRSAVPLFVMISGAFMNGNDIKGNIKRALKFFVILMLFAAVYVVSDNYYWHNGESFTFMELLRRSLDYKYHLWYIPVYIELLLVAPIINTCISKNNALLKYMLILFFVFTLIPHMLRMFWGDDYYIDKLAGLIPFYTIRDYLGYWLLGKYLIDSDINRICNKIGMRISIYFMGILSIFVSARLTRVKSMEIGGATEQYIDNMGIFVFLEAVAFFVFATRIKIPNICKKSISFVSEATFSIYLTHVLFVDLFTLHYGFTPCSMNPKIGVPVKTLAVFICSFLLFLIWKLVKQGMKAVMIRRNANE